MWCSALWCRRCRIHHYVAALPHRDVKHTFHQLRIVGTAEGRREKLHHMDSVLECLRKTNVFGEEPFFLHLGVSFLMSPCCICSCTVYKRTFVCLFLVCFETVMIDLVNLIVVRNCKKTAKSRKIYFFASWKSRKTTETDWVSVLVG